MTLIYMILGAKSSYYRGPARPSVRMYW